MKTLCALCLAVPLLLASLAVTADAVEPHGARHPALSPDGKQLAFDWRGDIWVVSTDGGRARRLTVHTAHDAYPRWSPDGSEIAFSSDRHGNHDVFVVGARGGTPERLTFHSGDDYVCDWSADGKRIYFESRREERFWLVHAVARSGGRPLRVIGDRSASVAESPDGRWLAYVRGGTPWWRKHYRGPASRDLWVRATAGGESRLLTAWDGDDDLPQWSPGGNALYFQSERQDGVMNLYRLDLLVDDDGVRAAGEPLQLTRLDTDGMQFLDVSADGQLAAFESEGRLWTVPTAGGAPRAVPIDCPGDWKDNPVVRSILSKGATEYAFAPGEKQVAFVVEGEIYAARLKDDTLKDPMRLTETDAREKDLDWLDEHTLVFVSDRHGNDDIFLLRSTDGEEPLLARSRYREAVRLTDSPETEARPQVSPDGKTILYRRGIGYLWTMDPDGKDRRQLADVPEVLHTDWSPDSRYIAYSITTLGHAEDIFIFDRETGNSTNVSNHPNDDFHPLWTGDGKRLSWASRTEDGFYSLKYLWLTKDEADKTKAEREREEEDEDDDGDDDGDDGKKKGKKHGKRGDADDDDDDDGNDDDDDDEPPVVRIDWDGVPDRIRTVATVRGYYWDYAQSPDGKHYALRTDSVEKMELWTVDWDGDRLRRMTHGGADPSRLEWSEDSETVRYLSGGRIYEIDNEEGASPTQLGFSVELTVDQRQRRLQKLGEAWRLLNDGFYDGTFHGVDWPAMRARYEPLAAEAVMTEDFNDVVREMIGELNASHLGIYGPRDGEGDETGLLGFIADDTYAGPGVRVTEVLRHGPLDREGRRVGPGDVILAIDGEAIEPGANYYPMLDHKAGKEVDLLVAADAAGTDRRTITIEPATNGAVRRLAYKQWVDDNRRRVETASGGRLGYVHVPAMGDDNWDAFIEDLFAWAHGREGLVLDIRGNSGGLIHDRLLTFLSRKPYCYSTTRDGRITYNSLQRWDGPTVLLINERCYSDGEIFPWGFKALGLGTVMGVPTYGAVIGTHDVELIDGAGFRIPSSGWYRMDGTNLENGPVEPDILVPEVPEENLRGADVQLESAIAECLRQLGDGGR